MIGLLALVVARSQKRTSFKEEAQRAEEDQARALVAERTAAFTQQAEAQCEALAKLRTNLAPALLLVEAVAQDVSWVLLNLFTNAFYAV